MVTYDVIDLIKFFHSLSTKNDLLTNMNIRLVNLLRRKFETDRVDAVSLACWFGAVVEYVAKVGVALLGHLKFKST